jgi:GGDEF domain-containing protein
MQNGMRKAIVIIYAILSVFVFMAIFLVLGFWFMNLYERNLPDIKTEFEGLRQKAEYAARAYNPIDVAAIQAAANDAISSSDILRSRLAAYTVYSRQNGIILWGPDGTRPADSYIKPESHLKWEWKGHPEYTKDLFGMDVFTVKLMPEVDDVYFDGLFSVITRAEIYDSLKWGFLALSVWLIIAIVIRLFLAAKPDPSPYVLSEQETDTQNRLYQPLPEYEEKPVIAEEEPVQQSLPIQPVRKPPKAQVEAKKTKELFSPTTGLGWEEHLEPRIKFELKRTASFDQDMVLALIRIDKAESRNQIGMIYPAIARIIHDLFQFQDLSFEYRQYGFAIVMTDMNLNTAIEQMKSFQRRISKERFDEGPVSLSIGLSARNGRLLSEKVLLQESQAALERAQKEGENRIVAFKPDPDKYRDFISKKI